MAGALLLGCLLATIHLLCPGATLAQEVEFSVPSYYAEGSWEVIANDNAATYPFVRQGSHRLEYQCWSFGKNVLLRFRTPDGCGKAEMAVRWTLDGGLVFLQEPRDQKLFITFPYPNHPSLFNASIVPNGLAVYALSFGEKSHPWRQKAGTTLLGDGATVLSWMDQNERMALAGSYVLHEIEVLNRFVRSYRAVGHGPLEHHGKAGGAGRMVEVTWFEGTARPGNWAIGGVPAETETVFFGPEQNGKQTVSYKVRNVVEKVTTLEPGLTWEKVMERECAGMRVCREGPAPEAERWLAEYLANQGDAAAGGMSAATARVRRLASGNAGFLAGAVLLAAAVAIVSRRRPAKPKYR